MPSLVLLIFSVVANVRTLARVRSLRGPLAFACFTLAVSTVAAQQSIRLHASARVPDLQRVTLGQLASVDGPGADTLAALVIPPSSIAPARGGSATFDIAALRALLARTPDVNMGRIALSGANVEIREAASPPIAIEAPTAAPVAQLPQVPGLRVRDVIAPRIAQQRGVAEIDVKLTFDASDTDILDKPLDGLTCAVVPTGTSDRQPLHIRLYKGDQLVLARSLRVGVVLQREVAIATRDIRKGELLDPSLLTTQSRWLAPSVNAARSDEVLGKAARAPIAAGSVIEVRQTDEPVVVRKGERIVVDCMIDGVLVRSTMRAGAQARVGDVILVQPLQAPGNAAQATAVYARIHAPGKAVVTTQPSPALPAAPTLTPMHTSALEAQPSAAPSDGEQLAPGIRITRSPN